MMMILGASHVLLGLIMLLCANVADGQPGGVGLFAMAGIVLPAQAMHPAPAVPEPWRPHMPPTMPLGRLVAAGGHRVGIPMGFSDGLNMEENEKVVWHWPLILVALASSGILSKKCSEVDLSPAGSAPALGKQWTCCQAAISAFVGIRMQALKYMHNFAFALIPDVCSVYVDCTRVDCNDDTGYLPMVLSFSVYDAPAWALTNMSAALTEMERRFRAMAVPTLDQLDMLGKLGMQWYEYERDVKKYRDMRAKIDDAAERDRYAAYLTVHPDVQ